MYRVLTSGHSVAKPGGGAGPIWAFAGELMRVFSAPPHDRPQQWTAQGPKPMGAAWHRVWDATAAELAACPSAVRGRLGLGLGL